MPEITSIDKLDKYYISEDVRAYQDTNSRTMNFYAGKEESTDKIYLKYHGVAEYIELDSKKAE